MGCAQLINSNVCRFLGLIWKKKNSEKKSLLLLLKKAILE
jgi:hypothetical protein